MSELSEGLEEDKLGKRLSQMAWPLACVGLKLKNALFISLTKKMRLPVLGQSELA